MTLDVTGMIFAGFGVMQVRYSRTALERLLWTTLSKLELFDLQ